MPKVSDLVNCRQADEVTAHRFLRCCCGIEVASVALDLLGWQTRAMADYHPCTGWIWFTGTEPYTRLLRYS